jgi:3-dehydroquinate synthase
MRQVDVGLGARSYRVLIGEGLIDRAGEWLAPLARNAAITIVSEENVWTAQGKRLVDALARTGTACNPILVAPGEASKSWATLATVIDRLVELGTERQDHIVAFGGGVIGDLTGFAAAILNRGCNYVQIPTSLLAQVDSSVGGKTAINVPAGKNLVGAFHQPSLVLIDPLALATLPTRELRAGYAEVVKYGLIGDPAFFDWCEAHGHEVIAGDVAAQSHAIEASVGAKALIVAEDERETSGRRALLNLGHTFGHALEAETGFSDRLLHGEAVAIGMALAFHFSARRGLCSADDAARATAHLAAVGLPTQMRGIETTAGRLMAHMAKDKKKSGGRVSFILARAIGEAFVDAGVDLGDVETFLAEELG